MNFSFVSGELARASGELLVIPLFEGESGDTPSAAIAGVHTALDARLLAAATQEGFKGKAEQTFVMHTLGKLEAERVLLLGLGTRARYTPEVLRLTAGRAAKTAQRLKARSLVFAVPGGVEGTGAVRAVVEGLELGVYRFDRYKSSAREEKNAPKLTAVKLHLAGEKTAALEQALALAQRVAEATNWARDLVNEPPNVVNPVRLAQAAQEMGRASGLKVSVSGRKEIEKLRMGMFLAVAQGSANEPQLIHVVYTPKNAKQAKLPPVALVGKAITFDSGGLSLKPTDSMVDMKTDMAGSAAVLGAMKVIAALKPPFPVHAFIGACENMPSGTSYRPSDVIVSRLGKTVEVTNTDAEGRLVLGDVITWANEQKPAVLIDLATLTGACVVALGNYIVGAFGDHDATVNEVLESARAAGEEMWRLPVTELQKDALRSEIADMKNSGERWAGATNAALFLKEFVGETPWVHLDIAGPSISPKERGYNGKGPTGVGVRTLVEFVQRRGAQAGTDTAPEAPVPAPAPAETPKAAKAPKASRGTRAKG
ncbi:leucyl aminopeptidase [Archangium primigenium]|uniref:leucyl aminopeptidase n=1 Tax=[Archangium] primigenium TaxID=2792470 RepID=UPI00195DB429|nr:leucyl aminopeptidase [Archangium primigenium]MBM7117736.1 leucyl aminopeptidase [Archangium primigenium]